MTPSPEPDQADRVRRIGLFLGPVVAVLLLAMPQPADMPQAAWRAAAITLLMVIWWITEAIPIPATSLIPLAAFPLLDILSSREVARQYGDHNIFLFMGGFFIALGMEKSGLHKRIALRTIAIMGGGLRSMVLGFMIASAFLSMWISNTATAMMMLPIAIAVVDKCSEQDARISANLGTALMLGIAYACSVGGMGTLIGTPPNIVLAGTIRKLLGVQAEIGFGQWLMIGLPLVIGFVPIIWWYLVRIAAPLPDHATRPDIEEQLQALGSMRRDEIIVAVVFGLTALAWTLRGPVLSIWFPSISDATVAMFFGLALFVIPTDFRRRRFAMDWDQAKKMPWGVLLLFGGGFALATGLMESGLSGWMGQRLSGLAGLPVPLMVALTCLLVTALTEVTSNTATTTTILPVLAATATGMGIAPKLLMIPATLAASCAFMLPVATPPNAIVFASGKVSLQKMFRTGIWMNLIGIALITLLVSALGPWLIS